MSESKVQNVNQKLLESYSETTIVQSNFRMVRDE